MFNKKQSESVNVNTTTTIIGNETTITGGVLSGQGSVRIDGQFTGEIKIGGHLVLGESGVIDGNAKSKSMLLAGKMLGNIICDSSLHIVSTGILKGDIEVGTLVVDEGAKFAGNCKMAGQVDKYAETYAEPAST